VGLLVVVGSLISLRLGATARDFGFSARQLWSDLKLGLTGFVMLAPPVYAIQGLLVYFWKPSKHPLMEMFKESPDPGFFAVLFAAAAVVAPLFEELVFRVLLQGLLEKAFSFAGAAHELVLGSPRGPVETMHLTAPASGAQENPVAAEIIFLSDQRESDANPYAASAVIGEGIVPAEVVESEDQQELRGPVAWLPIAVSSAIFALLHYDHGPDWVPLLLLAAGMGYLYQRTHRVVPCLVVHALLNSLSMFGLWLQVFVMPDQGL
jgi:membrane protease YdiL (CAAX protease family)